MYFFNLILSESFYLAFCWTDRANTEHMLLRSVFAFARNCLLNNCIIEELILQQ